MKPVIATTPSSGLLKKYNIQPAPESVARLGRLVSQRTADTDAIVKIVEGDAALKVRLLHLASPDDSIDEVEQAIFRCGVDAVLVLAMADPLFRAVTHAFDLLVAMPLTQVDESTIETLGGGYTASVRFTGPATGQVYVRMRNSFAQEICGKLFSMPPEKTTDAEITDTLGEIANTIVGNFRSNLCDAGLNCQLSIPSVSNTAHFEPPETRPGGHQAYAFQHHDEPLCIDIIIESTD